MNHILAGDSVVRIRNALTANSWFDPSGNLLQQINAGDGQVFAKSTYNGVGWVTATYRGYNASGTSYSQATTVDDDTIVEQTQNTYDEVGNLVSSASFQRLNDATGVGALGYTSAAYPSSIAAYPMLEGSGTTTADASGHGHTGTLTGGVTWGTSGPTGHCLTFNGSTGYVAFPASATVNTPSFTAAAWANLASGGGTYQNVVASVQLDVAGWYILSQSDGYWHAYLVGGTNYLFLTGAATSFDIWVHLALTYDQTSKVATLYADGVEVASGTFSAYTPNTSVPSYIGAAWDTSSPGFEFNGSVADVRLYTRALSADEIAGLYNLSPAARVSYTAAWFDGVDRPIASANYGAIDTFAPPDTMFTAEYVATSNRDPSRLTIGGL